MLPLFRRFGHPSDVISLFVNVKPMTVPRIFTLLFVPLLLSLLDPPSPLFSVCFRVCTLPACPLGVCCWAARSVGNLICRRRLVSAPIRRSRALTDSWCRPTPTCRVSPTPRESGPPYDRRAVRPSAGLGRKAAETHGLEPHAARRAGTMFMICSEWFEIRETVCFYLYDMSTTYLYFGRDS